MRRVLMALVTAAFVCLFGSVEVALADAGVQTAGGGNPVTGASASPTSDETGGGSASAIGGGGSQDVNGGGATSAAQSDTNGPGQGPSHVQGSNVPTQDTSSTSDAATDNGATVGQTSDQNVIGTANGSDYSASSPQGDGHGEGQGAGQGQGQGQGQGDGNGVGQGNGQGNDQGNGNGQAEQQAHAGQQADANAAALSSGSTNAATTVLVGPAATGNSGATVQTNSTTAAANATATHAATQDSSATSAGQTVAEQSATAAAQSQATEPENVAITARIEAPGTDGPVAQSNVISATADAITQSQGSDTTQQANAVAASQLESPSNTAVEVRVFSDGETAGGEQLNSSSAAATSSTDDSTGQAAADATLTDPSNTFVSIRVNSEGETGTYEQQNVVQASENGVITSTPDFDHATAWSGTDDASGVAIGLTTDGANTDLRITVDNPTLDRPSEGSTFAWIWDLVIGGDPISCTIGSTSGASRVDWTFDCDPANLINREPGSEPHAVANALTWNWDWSRPDLPGWAWTKLYTITIPDCPSCAYVFDFRWITLEPDASAPAREPIGASASSPVSVQQVNVASATASATADSTISQSITQTRSGDSERTQVALQQANVIQNVISIAAAELRNAANRVVIAHGIATQWNWAAAVVNAGAAAQIAQDAQQYQGGNGSLQVQLVLQSASFTQIVNAIGAAAIRGGVNSSTSRRGDGIQSTLGTASGNGRAAADTRQLIVQEQFGNNSDLSQTAAQWAVVVQHIDVQAAAALATGLNTTWLDNDAMNQRTRVASTSRNNTTAAVAQTAIQLQDADGAAQSQESYQLANIQQLGAAVASAEAGRIEHRYATAPAGAPPITEVGSTTTVSHVSGATRIVVVNTSSGGITQIVVNGVPTPVALPPRSLIVSLPSIVNDAVRIAAPAMALTFSQVLASAHGPFAGTMDAEGAEASSPRFPGFAPEHLGATAASAGTGGMGVLAALMALSLIRAPRRGRRLFSPAGRRPAAALLRQERPG